MHPTASRLLIAVLLVVSSLVTAGGEAAADPAVPDGAVFATAGKGYEAWSAARRTSPTTYEIDAGVRGVTQAEWTLLPSLVIEYPYDGFGLEIAGTARGNFWLAYSDVAGVRAVRLRSRSATFDPTLNVFPDLPGYRVSITRSGSLPQPMIGTSADGSVAVVGVANRPNNQLGSTVIATLAQGRGSFVSTLFPARTNFYAVRPRLAMSTAGHLVVAWSEREGIDENGMVATRGPGPGSPWAVNEVTQGVFNSAQTGAPAVRPSGLAAMGFGYTVLTFLIGSSTEWTPTRFPWSLAAPDAPMSGPSTGILRMRANLEVLRTRQILRCESAYFHEPVTSSYRWFRGSLLITRGTGPTYAWSRADEGKRVSCQVTAVTATAQWQLNSRRWRVPEAS